MPHFFLRLVPPRPTFATDMTAEEREVMVRHADYLSSLVDKGIGVAFGPVFDPEGAWGLGILEAADEAAARALTDKDPVVIAGIARYEVLPMRLPFLRKRTIELPNELYRRAMTEAAASGRTLDVLVEQGLRLVLKSRRRKRSADLAKLMERACSIVDSGVSDLASNPRHLAGFGQRVRNR